MRLSFAGLVGCGFLALATMLPASAQDVDRITGTTNPGGGFKPPGESRGDGWHSTIPTRWPFPGRFGGPPPACTGMVSGPGRVWRQPTKSHLRVH